MLANFLILACLISIVNANVIGIDFGSDTMKVAIVQPGTPLEVVTNFQSKRKTPTCLAFYRGERHFGADGYALIGRKPELSIAKFNRIIGKDPEHPHTKELKAQYFPYEIYSNETSGSTCVKVEDTYYTAEELMAMMLQHAKQITHNFGGKVIKDCVITVPSSFTQHERSALFTAASIADLNVLTLIEENTAAALHYGIDRVFEQPNTVLFYNMGASSVQVTIVTYSAYTVKDGSKNKTIGQFEVVGKAWDEGLGGFNFDVKLTDLLAVRFNEVWNKRADGKGKDVRDFYRPMTRLRLEANKIKEVLSANNEFPFKAEQLHADVDLTTKITRAEFEDACSDLIARLTKPIEGALAMANLTLGDVHAVELLGGSVRIPKVKKTLDEYFKASKLELGQHLNGDEAMALGAAFRAANLSTNFRVRKVGLTETSTYGVSVRLETLPKSDEPVSGGFFGSLGSLLKGGASANTDTHVEGEESWSKHTGLYPSKSTFPSKSKTLAFHYDKDILCKVHYDDNESLPAGEASLLAVYNITGIAEFAKEAAGRGLEQPKVHLSFSLDSSGVVVLHRAEATVELPVTPAPEEPVVPTVLSDNVDNTSSTSETSEAKPEAEGEGDAKTTDKDKSSKDKSSKDKKSKDKKDKQQKKEKEVKKDSTLRRVLTISENHKLVSPATWSASSIAEARTRLRALDLIDETRKAREAALNDLEGYIYSVKNKISDNEDGLKKVSTDEQRNEVLELASAAEDWLYDEGRTADLAAYKAKHSELRLKAEAIFSRYSELSDRPAAVSKARKQLGEVRKKVDAWGEALPHVTEGEKEKLLEAVGKVESWLLEKEGLQAQRSAFEDAVFESADVPLQLKTVSLQFEKLMKKPKPPVEKEKVSPVNSKDSKNNSTSSASNSTAEEEPVRVYVNVDEEKEKSSEDSHKETEPAVEEKEEEADKPAASSGDSEL